MTQDNIFREIEEDLERQRYEELWKRYGAYVVAAALVIVLGTAAYNFWQSRTLEAHQKATGELAEVLSQKTDQGKQIAALQNFAADNKGQTQAVFAELRAAALAAKQDKKDDAVRIYDAVAADPNVEHEFRQLADLLSVELQLDSGDPAQLQKRLEPLMGDKEPWHYSAKEYAGYLALRAGDKIRARQLFTDLAQDAGAPQSLNARAADMLRLLQSE